MSGMFDKAGGGKSNPNSARKTTDFKETEKRGRGAFSGGLGGHVAEAFVTGLGMLFGFKTMGPVGMAGGALAGKAAGETVKHYLGSFVGSRTSGGGAASSFANIGELKQAVANETKRATDEGDVQVSGAKSRLDAAYQRIDAATDESGHSDVADMKAAVLEAIALCEDSVVAASKVAQERASAWAGGL